MNKEYYTKKEIKSSVDWLLEDPESLRVHWINDDGQLNYSEIDKSIRIAFSYLFLEKKNE